MTNFGPSVYINFFHTHQSMPMRKFTTAAALSLAGVLAAGTTSPRTQTLPELSGLEEVALSPGASPLRNLSTPPLALGVSAADCVEETPARAPESGWESIGEATWIEDFFTPFGDVPEGVNWKVEVEKSGDWYRCLPYSTGPVADNMNKYDTESYFYVNASDPEKVWFETVWFWGGDFGVTCLVPENGWGPEYFKGYGTLKDNVIHFPPGTAAINFIEKWFPSCPNDGAYLVLPGGETPGIHDYSFGLSVPMCPDADREFNIEVACGADIPAYVIGVVNKLPALTENNLKYVAEHGTRFDRTTTKIPYSANPGETDPGLKYVIAVAVDEDGNVIQGLLDFFILSFNDSEQWVDAGTVEFTDPFVAGIYQLDITEPYEVACQENAGRPGYYRLVNPYHAHPVFGQATDKWSEYTLGHDHDHYIYIDATDPSFVKIEPSALGLAARYGDMYVGDMLSYFIGLGNSLDALIQAGYQPGYMEDGFITFPARSLYLGEKLYADGAPQSCGEAVLDFTGVAGIHAVGADDPSAPVEYFNLQGIRVTDPAAGVYIRRQGATVSKITLP